MTLLAETLPDFGRLVAWLLAGGGLLTALALAIRARRPRRSIRALRAGAPGATDQTTALSADVTAEFEAVADRASRDLEERVERLRRLIRAADQRIVRLAELSPGDAETAPAPRRMPDARPADDAGAHASAGNHAALSHERVYALADEGLSPARIAENLHLPIGEVELILNLRSFAR